MRRSLTASAQFCVCIKRRQRRARLGRARGRPAPDGGRAARRRGVALVAGQPGPRAVQLRHHGQPARAPVDRRGALLDDALAHGRVQPRLGPRPDGRLQGAPTARRSLGSRFATPRGWGQGGGGVHCGGASLSARTAVSRKGVNTNIVHLDGGRRGGLARRAGGRAGRAGWAAQHGTGVRRSRAVR